jgi:hypothetical protein
MGRSWTHRVVKRARGMQGEYFDFVPAATFDSLREAEQYAEEFAREQAGVGGVIIDIRLRSGGTRERPGKIIRSIRADAE